MKNAGFLYIAGHGTPNDTTDGYFLILRLVSCQAALAWKAGNTGISIGVVCDGNGNPRYYEIKGNSSWAANNWLSTLAANKTISILSFCYSKQNGWANACGSNSGSVAFGYNQSVSIGVDFNNSYLLRTMNGKENKGKYRTAGDAYINTNFSEGFDIVPFNALNTLCPTPKINGFGPVGLVQNPFGTGYLEMDTYCNAKINPNNIFSFSKTGDVSVSNLRWTDVTNGKSCRLEFDYTGSGSFQVNVTVNTAQVRSWSSDTNFFFQLDWDRKTPPEPYGNYSFNYIQQTPIASFYANPTYGTAPVRVNFSDASTGNIQSWEWSFPGANPSSSSERNPKNIIYENEGTYTVSLTVSDGSKSNTKTRTDYIIVGEQNGNSTFTLDGYITDGASNLIKNFNIAVWQGCELSPFTFEFNFGDGTQHSINSSILCNHDVSHTYSQYGVYSPYVVVYNAFESAVFYFSSFEITDPFAKTGVDFSSFPNRVWKDDNNTFTFTVSSNHPPIFYYYAIYDCDQPCAQYTLHQNSTSDSSKTISFTKAYNKKGTYLIQIGASDMYNFPNQINFYVQVDEKFNCVVSNILPFEVINPANISWVQSNYMEVDLNSTLCFKDYSFGSPSSTYYCKGTLCYNGSYGTKIHYTQWTLYNQGTLIHREIDTCNFSGGGYEGQYFKWKFDKEILYDLSVLSIMPGCDGNNTGQVDCKINSIRHVNVINKNKTTTLCNESTLNDSYTAGTIKVGGSNCNININKPITFNVYKELIFYDNVTISGSDSDIIVVNYKSIPDYTSLCYKEDTINNAEDKDKNQTDISDYSEIHPFLIYPNPSTNIFFIKEQQEEFDLISVEIFNLLGEKTNYFRFESDSKLEMNLSNNPSGIYFAKINIDGQIAIEKILLRKE